MRMEIYVGQCRRRQAGITIQPPNLGSCRVCGEAPRLALALVDRGDQQLSVGLTWLGSTSPGTDHVSSTGWKDPFFSTVGITAPQTGKTGHHLLHKGGQRPPTLGLPLPDTPQGCPLTNTLYC